MNPLDLFKLWRLKSKPLKEWEMTDMGFLAKLLDKAIPIGIGQRTAIFSVIGALLTAFGAFGISVSPAVTTGVATLAGLFGVAHLTRTD